MFNCYDCAFKHLATASRVWVELHQGYGDDVAHIVALIGDLACAADHLYQEQPELSASLRNDRILILRELAAKPGLPPETRPDFEQYLRVILEIMQNAKRRSKGN